MRQVHVEGAAEAEVGVFIEPGKVQPSGVLIIFTPHGDDARPVGLVLESAGKVGWLVDKLLNLQAEVWPLTDEQQAELDAQGSRDDEARFQGWRDRLAALDQEEVLVDDEVNLLREEGPRFRLIEDIHSDIAGRYPLGIAGQLSVVLNLLACAEQEADEEALALLDDLIDAERRSRAANAKAAT